MGVYSKCSLSTAGDEDSGCCRYLVINQSIKQTFRHNGGDRLEVKRSLKVSEFVLIGA